MRNKHVYGSLRSYVGSVATIFPFDRQKLFGRQAPLEIEIGFGTGEYLVGLALRYPDRDFIGFEQCAGRIVKALRKIHLAGVTNVRLLNLDVIQAMRYVFVPGSLQTVHCLFPCPWPKKRHAKHRLFSAAFLRLLNSRLEDRGLIKIVTDHHPYSAWIAEQLAETGLKLEQRSIPPCYGTKFEQKWQAAGQADFDELVLTSVRADAVPVYQGVDVRIYYLDKLDPSQVQWKGLKGALSVQFRDFIYDPMREAGMVQAVISEDGCMQYLGIGFNLASGRWCVRPVPGSGVLPTEGVNTALRLAFESLQESCRSKA
jgi:tRNA (guanine-N7-)-methyltransferase